MDTSVVVVLSDSEDDDIQIVKTLPGTGLRHYPKPRPVVPLQLLCNTGSLTRTSGNVKAEPYVLQQFSYNSVQPSTAMKQESNDSSRSSQLPPVSPNDIGEVKQEVYIVENSPSVPRKTFTLASSMDKDPVSTPLFQSDGVTSVKPKSNNSGSQQNQPESETTSPASTVSSLGKCSNAQSYSKDVPMNQKPTPAVPQSHQIDVMTALSQNSQNQHVTPDYATSLQNSQNQHVTPVQNNQAPNATPVQKSQNHYLAPVQKSQNQQVASVQNSQNYFATSVQNSQNHYATPVQKDSYLGVPGVVPRQQNVNYVLTGSREKRGEHNKSQNQQATSVQNSQNFYVPSLQKSQNYYLPSVQKSQNTYVTPVQKSQNTYMTPVQNTQNYYMKPVQNNQTPFMTPVQNNQNPYVSPVQNNINAYVTAVQKSQNLYATPIQNNHNTYVTPVQNNQNTYVTPVQKSQNLYATPVQNNQNTFVTPVQNNQNPYVTPVQNNQNIYVTPVQNNQNAYVTPVNNQNIYVTPVQNNQNAYVTPVNNQNIYVTPVQNNRNAYVTPVQNNRNAYVTPVQNSQNHYATSVQKDNSLGVPDVVPRQQNGNYVMTGTKLKRVEINRGNISMPNKQCDPGVIQSKFQQTANHYAVTLPTPKSQTNFCQNAVPSQLQQSVNDNLPLENHDNISVKKELDTDSGCQNKMIPSKNEAKSAAQPGVENQFPIQLKNVKREPGMDRSVPVQKSLCTGSGTGSSPVAENPFPIQTKNCISGGQELSVDKNNHVNKRPVQPAVQGTSNNGSCLVSKQPELRSVKVEQDYDETDGGQISNAGLITPKTELSESSMPYLSPVRQQTGTAVNPSKNSETCRNVFPIKQEMPTLIENQQPSETPSGTYKNVNVKQEPQNSNPQTFQNKTLLQKCQNDFQSRASELTSCHRQAMCSTLTDKQKQLSQFIKGAAAENSTDLSAKSSLEKDCVNSSGSVLPPNSAHQDKSGWRMLEDVNMQHAQQNRQIRPASSKGHLTTPTSDSSKMTKTKSSLNKASRGSIKRTGNISEYFTNLSVKNCSQNPQGNCSDQSEDKDAADPNTDSDSTTGGQDNSDSNSEGHISVRKVFCNRCNSVFFNLSKYEAHKSYCSGTVFDKSESDSATKTESELHVSKETEDVAEGIDTDEVHYFIVEDSFICCYCDFKSDHEKTVMTHCEIVHKVSIDISEVTNQMDVMESDKSCAESSEEYSSSDDNEVKKRKDTPLKKNSIKPWQKSIAVLKTKSFVRLLGKKVNAKNSGEQRILCIPCSYKTVLVREMFDHLEGSEHLLKISGLKDDHKQLMCMPCTFTTHLITIFQNHLLMADHRVQLGKWKEAGCVSSVCKRVESPDSGSSPIVQHNRNEHHNSKNKASFTSEEKLCKKQQLDNRKPNSSGSDSKASRQPESSNNKGANVNQLNCEKSKELYVKSSAPSTDAKNLKVNTSAKDYGSKSGSLSHNKSINRASENHSEQISMRGTEANEKPSKPSNERSDTKKEDKGQRLHSKTSSKDNKANSHHSSKDNHRTSSKNQLEDKPSESKTEKFDRKSSSATQLRCPGGKWVRKDGKEKSATIISDGKHCASSKSREGSHHKSSKHEKSNGASKHDRDTNNMATVSRDDSKKDSEAKSSKNSDHKKQSSSERSEKKSESSSKVLTSKISDSKSSKSSEGKTQQSSKDRSKDKKNSSENSKGYSEKESKHTKRSEEQSKSSSHSKGKELKCTKDNQSGSSSKDKSRSESSSRDKKDKELKHSSKSSSKDHGNRSHSSVKSREESHVERKPHHESTAVKSSKDADPSIDSSKEKTSKDKNHPFSGIKIQSGLNDSKRSSSKDTNPNIVESDKKSRLSSNDKSSKLDPPKISKDFSINKGVLSSKEKGANTIHSTVHSDDKTCSSLIDKPSKGSFKNSDNISSRKRSKSDDSSNESIKLPRISDSVENHESDDTSLAMNQIALQANDIKENSRKRSTSDDSSNERNMKYPKKEDLEKTIKEEFVSPKAKSLNTEDIKPRLAKCTKIVDLITNISDFSEKPYACALCFYRSQEVQGLVLHVENHLSGGDNVKSYTSTKATIKKSSSKEFSPPVAGQKELNIKPRISLTTQLPENKGYVPMAAYQQTPEYSQQYTYPQSHKQTPSSTLNASALNPSSLNPQLAYTDQHSVPTVHNQIIQYTSHISQFASPHMLTISTGTVPVNSSSQIPHFPHHQITHGGDEKQQYVAQQPQQFMPHFQPHPPSQYAQHPCQQYLSQHQRPEKSVSQNEQQFVPPKPQHYAPPQQQLLQHHNQSQQHYVLQQQQMQQEQQQVVAQKSQQFLPQTKQFATLYQQQKLGNRPQKSSNEFQVEDVIDMGIDFVKNPRNPDPFQCLYCNQRAQNFIGIVRHFEHIHTSIVQAKITQAQMRARASAATQEQSAISVKTEKCVLIKREPMECT